ncbi:Prefoldin beta-like protein [Schizopora paradoxa]|uniref:Prefoldin beta-like protein n=1 Tax=Schizopora paradoxa TaxID=27342 RepID=A0A0H2S851_9AGAM|nr:Prefoldin beta-like protein [Schizopora paradoxa]
MSVEARLKTESADYQKLQLDLSKVIENSQQLEAQLTETQSVRDVFVNLKAENTVYKMIGPVLVQQDSAEAKANVNKRLEFIQTELKRAEVQIKDLSGKIEKKKETVRDPA